MSHAKDGAWGAGGGGSGFGIFSQERLQHSTLTEVLAAMPVGKIEMGFIDITMRRTLVFWKPPPPPQGEIVRAQVLLMKEDRHFSLLYTTAVVHFSL